MVKENVETVGYSGVCDPGRRKEGLPGERAIIDNGYSHGSRRALPHR